MTKQPIENTSESMTEIDLGELDSREIAKLDRASLEKLLAGLDAKKRRIKAENVDRQTTIAKLQFETNHQGAELPQIGHFLTIAREVLTRIEVESQLIDDVKALRPMCDRVNAKSRELYDLLAEYLTELDRVQKLQKGTDFKAEFIVGVQPGNLPVIEHSEGLNKFELKTVNAAVYQRQNRTSAFAEKDFGFSDHQYRSNS
jgi:hypothetical protein